MNQMNPSPKLNLPRSKLFKNILFYLYKEKKQKMDVYLASKVRNLNKKTKTIEVTSKGPHVIIWMGPYIRTALRSNDLIG